MICVGIIHSFGSFCRSRFQKTLPFQTGLSFCEAVLGIGKRSTRNSRTLRGRTLSSTEALNRTKQVARMERSAIRGRPPHATPHSASLDAGYHRGLLKTGREATNVK